MKKSPYERQYGESAKAFEAFTVYRDMGLSRSLREVAQKLGKNKALIERWSSQWNWVERAQSYDDDMDRKALLQQEQERREMVKRHAKQAMMFQQKVLQRLNSLKVEELSPNDLIKWFTESVKIERLSRGEPIDIAEVAHGGEVTEKHEHNINKRIEKYEEVYLSLATESGEDEGDYEDYDLRE